MADDRSQQADELAAKVRPAVEAEEGTVNDRGPRPLPNELLPVAPFPLDALPEAFRAYVTDVAERMQCPPDFVAVPLVVAAASLVARRVSIRLRRHDDWTEPGNLWALIVGRPGVMKSPAMKQALAPLERLERRATDRYNLECEQHRLEEQVNKLRAEAATKDARSMLKANRNADVSAVLGGQDETPPPVRRRYIVNGPTWEKLHELMAVNEGGLLMERDEMRGWLLDMGREEQAEARAFYLKSWSGGQHTVDRIGRGTITAATCLSIVGAIQPGPLSYVVRGTRKASGDDGLLERFLIVWPDDPKGWCNVDRQPDAAARQRVWDIFDRLDTFMPDAFGAERDTTEFGEVVGMPFLRIDDEGQALFEQWLDDHYRRLHDDEGVEAALAKFRHHVPALALTLHVVDGGVGPVGKSAMLGALALGEYFESHTRRLHASGHRAVVRAARAVIGKVRSGALPTQFNAREAYRPQWAGLTDGEVVQDALDMLVDHGWLVAFEVRTLGRPTMVYALTEGARDGQVA